MGNRFCKIAILIILLMGSAARAEQAADSPIDPQFQVSREQLQAIEKEIATLRSEASRLAAQENSIIASLDQFDVQIQLNVRQIELLRLKQLQTQAEIDRLNGKYQAQMGDLNRQKEYLGRRLVQAYKLGELNYLKLMLQVNNSADLVRSYQYITYLAKDDMKRVDEYRASLEELDRMRIRLEQENRNLVRLRQDSEAAQTAFLQNKQEKVRLLQAIQDQREMHLNTVSELKVASSQLKRFFTDLEPPPADTTAPGDTIAQYKGLLNWPIGGKVTREFGITKHPRFGTTTVNNGIEIAADEGTPVRAVFGGQVVFAEWFKGYGESIILSHGNEMYTLYAHNSELNVQRGETVTRDQIIARAGSTAALNGSCLYFEIRFKDQPLNPIEWLRRTR